MSSNARGDKTGRDRPATRSSQINLRVTPEVEEVLEAAAFVHNSRSIQQLLAPVVVELATKFAQEEAVQAAMNARHRQRARGV